MIKTEYIHPPIGVRHFDWMAYIPDNEGEGPTGYGETEIEALHDLCEQLAEQLFNKQKAAA